MDLSQIRELLSVVAESNVEELTVEEDDLKITVRKSAPTVTMQPQRGGGYAMPQAPPAAGYAAPQAPPAQQPPARQPPASQQPPAAPQEQPGAPAGDGTPPAGEEEAAAEGTTVPAPIVGTFYRRPSPDDDPYVEVGDTVKEGDVLCIIEAMKLMNEIECETPGTVKEILAEDAEPVEYEQPLFVIEE